MGNAILIQSIRDRLDVALPQGEGSPRDDSLTARILKVGLVLALIALVLQTVGDVLNRALLDDPYRVFNVDEDVGIWTWSSGVAEFGTGYAALILRLMYRRWQFTVIAFVGAFSSFDDFYAIHERVGQLNDELGFPENWNARYLWVLVFLPLFGLAAAVLWVLGERLTGRAASFLKVGVLLLGSALLLELSTPLWLSQWSGGSWQLRVEILPEEGAELVGWALTASALTALALQQRGARLARSELAGARPHRVVPRRLVDEDGHAVADHL